MKTTIALTCIVSLPLLITGCSSTHEHHHHGAAATHQSSWSAVKQLVAVIHPTAGNKCSGTVRFSDFGGGKIEVVAELEGLNFGQKHAMHVHEFGDCSGPDGMKTGGHYNPEGHQHGLVEAATRHAGDLGNVQADAAGKASYRIVVANISLVGVKNPVIGRGVIVHAKPDDGGQPTGNAGARIGAGVIGIANVPAVK